MKIVAIIQARMGSTRLPGKVLEELAGVPMLVRCVTRVLQARLVDEVIVATTAKQVDASIVDLCQANGFAYFRGSEHDVLDRYYGAAVATSAESVVRITSDCPLIAPDVIDRVVQEFVTLQPRVAYACNFLPKRTYPRGLDVEVFRFEALETAWREDTNAAWREHVTPYINRAPERFAAHGVVHDVDYSGYRWTVDTLEDLQFARRVYDHFGDDDFSWHDLLRVLERHPEWAAINQHVQQRIV